MSQADTPRFALRRSYAAPLAMMLVVAWFGLGCASSPARTPPIDGQPTFPTAVWTPATVDSDGTPIAYYVAG